MLSDHLPRKQINSGTKALRQLLPALEGSQVIGRPNYSSHLDDADAWGVAIPASRIVIADGSVT